MHIKTSIPSLGQLLEALPNRDPKVICRQLDITPQTLRRWHEAGTAPQMAMVALYYLGWHGRQEVHLDAHNDACAARVEVASLKKTIKALWRALETLESLGTHGAANDPILRPEALPRADQVLYEGPKGRSMLVGTDTAAMWAKAL